MKKSIMAILIATSALSGCIKKASYPDNPRQIRLTESYTSEEACREYSALKRYYNAESLAPLLQQAIIQGGVRASKAYLISQGLLQIGFSTIELICAWGQPQYVNKTVTKYSVTEQFVYGSGTYVYLENGKVNAWQK